MRRGGDWEALQCGRDQDDLQKALWQLQISDNNVESKYKMHRPRANAAWVAKYLVSRCNYKLEVQDQTRIHYDALQEMNVR